MGKLWGDNARFHYYLDVTLCLFLPVLALIIAGCYASHGDDEQRPGAEDFCAAQARGFCAYFEGCCNAEELEELSVEHFNCPDIHAGESYLGCMNVLEPLTDAGRVVVDDDALAVFQQTFTSMGETCPDFYETPITRSDAFRMLYDPVLVGTVAEGDGCARTDECMDGFYCDLAVDACSRQAEQGEPCGSEEECRLGLSCSRDICIRPGGEGSPCEEYVECMLGLWCDSGRCAPLLPAGSTCASPTGSCEGHCVFEGPGVEGICVGYCNGI